MSVYSIDRITTKRKPPLTRAAKKKVVKLENKLFFKHRHLFLALYSFISSSNACLRIYVGRSMVLGAFSSDRGGGKEARQKNYDAMSS